MLIDACWPVSFQLEALVGDGRHVNYLCDGNQAAILSIISIFWRYFCEIFGSAEDLMTLSAAARVSADSRRRG